MVREQIKRLAMPRSPFSFSAERNPLEQSSKGSPTYVGEFTRGQKKEATL